MPQIIILYNTSDSYEFKVTSTLEPSTVTRQTLNSEENESFNLTIEKQTNDSLTTISYQNITVTQSVIANVTINQTTTNYTMEIDYNGDNITDETKDPDSIETNYAPTATIISPENHSIFVYGDEITFNGTGTDLEDGVLTNASLVWTSDLNGIIGVGNEFNTTNLSAGTHTITLMVNDSAGLIDTESIEILINAPDLTLESPDITFSNPNPAEGEIITINATIRNIGLIDATNVTVQFFDGIPEFQISNVTINSIRAGEDETVNVSWNTTGKMGKHSISVMIDPDDMIEEMNETDDQASRFVIVQKKEAPVGGTQVWYLTSEDKPVGAPTANDAQTHAKDNLMLKGSITGTGEYFSLNYTEVAWFYADTGAACDIGFGERPWEAHIRTEAIEGDEVGHNLTVEICRLDNGTGNVTVLASHTGQLTAVEPQHLWNLTCEDNESTTQDFSTGDWLAVRLSWGCPTDELRIYYKAEAGNDSYLESPTTDPGYPIPELSTLILLFTGVIALTVLFKRGR